MLGSVCASRHMPLLDSFGNPTNQHLGGGWATTPGRTQSSCAEQNLMLGYSGVGDQAWGFTQARNV